MKKIFVFLWVVLLVTSVQAKSLKDLWVSMPDSLLPTLDRNLRLELVELEEMGVKPNVKNLLGEECDMDSTKAYGADVVLCGEVFDESAAHAQELSDTIRSSDAAAADALTDVFSRIKEKTHA